MSKKPLPRKTRVINRGYQYSRKKEDKVKNITIISNKISYLKDKEEVEATGEVLIKDQNRNLNISADKIYYFNCF